MPTKRETDAWMERMDNFRARLRNLNGAVPADIQRDLLNEFEDLMTDMRITFGGRDA